MSLNLDNYKVMQCGRGIVDEWYEVVKEDKNTFFSTQSLNAFLRTLSIMRQHNESLPHVTIATSLKNDEVKEISKRLSSILAFSNPIVNNSINDEDL